MRGHVGQALFDPPSGDDDGWQGDGLTEGLRHGATGRRAPHVAHACPDEA